MLANKVALVTGASRGIGQAITLSLAKAGATVIGTATTESGATHISDYLKAHGYSGVGMCLNVNDNTAIQTMVGDIHAKFGAPNILVNNAAVTRDNLFIRMKDEEWNDVISTNLTAAYQLNKACIRAMMKARWGRIVTIGSLVASAGNPGQANYCAAKAGVIGMTKSIALELASRGITANVVAPGFIDTDMTRALTEEQRRVIIDHIPMGAVGQPEDIAHAVLFLVSDSASYITGQTLHVNGGMYLN